MVLMVLHIPSSYQLHCAYYPVVKVNTIKRISDARFDQIL